MMLYFTSDEYQILQTELVVSMHAFDPTSAVSIHSLSFHHHSPPTAPYRPQHRIDTPDKLEC
jgi:hypothetical protein